MIFKDEKMKMSEKNKIKLNINLLFEDYSSKDIILNDVDINAKIEQIKYRIEKLESIPIERQIIYFKGYEESLRNNETLKHYNIQNESKLTFEIIDEEIKDLIIKPIKGDNFNLNGLSIYDTVRTLKQKFYEKEGFPPEIQIFIYNKKKLEDNKRLIDYEIHNRVTVFIRLKIFWLKIISRDVFFVNFDLDKKDQYKIIDIKNRIKEKKNIPLVQQNLYFNGVKLEENKTFNDYKINSGDNLFLILENKKNKNLYIKINDNEILTLNNISESDIIKDIKSKIFEIKKIPIIFQDLIFGNEILSDNYTLFNYNIPTGTTIDLKYIKEGSIPILIKLIQGNKKEILNVDLSESVKKLKRRVYEKFKIPIEDQTLLYGKKLEDYYSLDHYKIKENSEIKLMWSMGRVDHYLYVIFDDKKFLAFFCGSCCDAVTQVKNDIERRLHIDINHQELLKDGKIINDENTFCSDFERGCELKLVLK